MKKFAIYLFSAVLILYASAAATEFLTGTSLVLSEKSFYVYDFYKVSEEEKTAKIIGYNVSGPSLNVIIPKTIDGYTVIEFDETIFKNLDSLTSVKIPDTVLLRLYNPH